MDARSNEEIIAAELDEYLDTVHADSVEAADLARIAIEALSDAGRHITGEREAVIDGQRRRLVAAQRYLWSEIEAAPCWEGWGHGDDEPLFRVIPFEPVLPSTDGPDDK